MHRKGLTVTAILIASIVFIALITAGVLVYNSYNSTPISPDGNLTNNTIGNQNGTQVNPIDTNPQTHLACISDRCVVVQGAGSNINGCTTINAACTTSGGGGGGGGGGGSGGGTGGTSNVAPTAQFEAIPSNGTAPLYVFFNGSGSSDSDGTIVSYAWNFGDNSSSTGMIVNHTYTIVGIYNVTLVVTDDDSATGSATSSINVGNPADTTPPQYSNVIANPANAVYTPIRVYTFSSTWTDNQGMNRVDFIFDGITYPATANGSTYTYVLNNLGAGTHTYSFRGFDLSSNTNQTTTTNYIVAKNTTNLNLVLTPSNTVQQTTQTTATGSNCPSQVVCVLTRNGASVSNPDVQTLVAGTYAYNYSSSGNANYSATSTSATLTVTSQPTFTLSVTKQATNGGVGTVTSSDGGINCGATCSANYIQNTVVTLNATANAGSSFSGWSGACSGSGACQVTMSQAQNVIATFALNAPTAPSNLQATAISQTRIDLTWTDNSNNEANFTLERAASSTFTTIQQTFTIAANTQSFSDTTLTAGTTYFYRVRANNAASSSSNSNTANATTAQQQFLLSVSKAGTGSGTITSNPIGINCGAVCSANYVSGTQVTLTANSSAGSTFAGWSGACTGTGSCSVTMSQAQSVTATFTLNPVNFTLAVSKVGTGSGTVTSNVSGINCGATCSATYVSGTNVLLTATPTAGSTFTGWLGACSGTGTCTVSMTANRSVTANFTLTQPQQFNLAVSKIGSGTGTVTSTPPGITCGSACSANYTSGTQVILNATPSSSSQLTPTLQVNGRYVLDRCGNIFVARGFEQNQRLVSFGGTAINGSWDAVIDQIDTTNSNIVRILPDDVTVAQTQAMIARAVSRNLIVDLHTSGSNYFAQPSVQTMVAQYKDHLILTVMGEYASEDRNQWQIDATSTVTNIRNMGYDEPIIIIAPNSGRDLQAILIYGQAIENADSLHKTIFGWQAYWGNSNWYQTFYGMNFSQALANISQKNFPIQLGLTYDADSPSDPINYSTLMSLTQQYSVGWLWWNYFNRNPADINDVVTYDGQWHFTSLGDSVFNDPNGFANIAVSKACTSAPVNSVFSGWSGACSGTGTCTLNMSVNRTAIANFTSSGTDVTPPGVTLTSPTNNATLTTSPATFTSQITDNQALKNATLWLWQGNTIISRTTQTISGTSTTTSFSNITIPSAGSYKWNVRAFDTSGNGAWAAANFTVTYSPNLCGNGQIDSGEQCDGANLGGNTCASVVGTGSTGTLTCSGTCTFNTAQCTPPSSSGNLSFSRTVIDSGFAGDVKAIGDIDGDGYPDLVIGGPAMNWYKYPTWAKTTIATPTNEFTTDMQLADIDSDGDLDMITADGNLNNNVIWFENPRPSGNPSSSTWIRHEIGAQGYYVHDFEIADFDNDGKLDVLARKGSTNIFFQNNGTWTRRDISQFVANADGEGMGIGDVDSDGDIDIVAGGTWVETPSNPRTAAFVVHTIASGWTGEITGTVADLNADTKPDVIFARQHGGGAFVWYESATPLTGPWTAHTIDNNMGGHKINVGDFNKDGRMDISIGLELTDLSVYINNGGTSPTFTKQRLSNTGLHNQRIGDIGSDGDLDIFGANYIGNPPVELWENMINAPLKLTNWTYKQVSSAHVQTFGLTFADVDHDGRVDIVSGAFWYRNPGGNLMGTWTQNSFPAGRQAMLVTDVDGDSFTDIIAQGAAVNFEVQLFWLEATNAQGTSWNSVLLGTIPQTSHSTLGTQGYRTAQLEAGGKEEVIVSTVSGFGIYYFRIPSNPGAGNWPRVQVNINPSDEGIGVGDIDRDGDLDLVATTGDTKRVEWYRNPRTGAGNWPATVIASIPQATWLDRVEVGDFNKDGKLDVVVTEEGNNADTMWFRQPADPLTPNWQQSLITTQTSTNSMDVADIDKDGDTDVIVAEMDDPKHVTIFANSGTGTFTPTVVSSGFESHLGARTADLDNDGDLDIVSIVWWNPNFVHLWRNDNKLLCTMCLNFGGGPEPDPALNSPPYSFYQKIQQTIQHIFRLQTSEQSKETTIVGNVISSSSHVSDQKSILALLALFAIAITLIILTNGKRRL